MASGRVIRSRWEVRSSLSLRPRRSQTGFLHGGPRASIQPRRYAQTEARRHQMFSGFEAALVVMPPGAEPVVKSFRDRFDPVAALGMPAHITVLYPFIP